MSLPELELPVLSFAGMDTAGLLPVDLDQLITSRLLIQASSGGGKSWALRSLLEQTHGRVQQIVLDKEGEFASLRERFDYVLAGTEGDVPARPESAGLLCRRLLELGASAVIDLYDLSLPERRRFVRLFLEALMALPKELWRPLVVVIDEAHFFCPEGASSEATDAVVSLCSEGRKRGYCAVLATQRLSKLNKDAAAELRNKLIGLTSLDVDVRRAADDLGFTREQGQTLKHLRPGQFYAVGPAVSPEVVLARTGEIQTTHPKAGRVSAGAPPPPQGEIQALLAQMRDLPQQAEEEANTADELRGQIASLKERLQARPVETKTVVQRVVERVEVPMLREGEAERLGRMADDMLSLGKDLVQTAGAMQASLRRGTAARNEANRHGETTADKIADLADIPGVNVEEKPSEDAHDMPSHVPAGQSVSGKLSGPQQRILNTLADLQALGIARAARSHVALFAKQSPTSSSFANNLGSLRTAGLIDYPGPGLLILTPTGQGRAVSGSQPPTRAALHAAWVSRLSGPQGRILAELIRAWPSPVTREALARRTGASTSSSSYANNLGALKSLGLASYPVRGSISATKMLFPEGLD